VGGRGGGGGGVVEEFFRDGCKDGDEGHGAGTYEFTGVVKGGKRKVRAMGRFLLFFIIELYDGSKIQVKCDDNILTGIRVEEAGGSNDVRRNSVLLRAILGIDGCVVR